MTSTTRQRWMQLDDRDASLNYTGTWFDDSYQQPLGTTQALGDLYRGTARGTNTAGVLKFSYNGGNVVIWGSSSSNPSGGSATISCTFDGMVASNDVVTNDNVSHWRLCQSKATNVGPHEVVLSINSGTSGIIFWVDFISYYSSLNPDLSGKSSQVGPGDSDVRFIGSGWRNDYGTNGDAGKATYNNGDKLRVPFYGSSVEFLGYQNSSMPRVPSTATWSIDGSRPMEVTIPAYADGFRGLPSNTTRFRVNLFETASVPPGNHTLEITHLGSPSSVPFSFDYLIVHHGNLSNQPGTPTGTPNPGTTNDGQGMDPHPKKSSTIPIVGGVVGGVVVLLLIGLLIFFWRKRQLRRQETAGGRKSIDEPWDPTGPTQVHRIDQYQYTSITPNSAPHGIMQPLVAAPATSPQQAFSAYPTSPPAAPLPQPPPGAGPADVRNVGFTAYRDPYYNPLAAHGVSQAQAQTSQQPGITQYPPPPSRTEYSPYHDASDVASLTASAGSSSQPLSYASGGSKLRLASSGPTSPHSIVNPPPEYRE